MNRKSLADLSLNISEEMYRDLPYLSYSTLARYEKGGFSSIAKLYDKVESEAITFGSMVDCLITEGLKIFEDKFIVVNDNIIPVESVKTVIDSIPFLEDTFDEITDDVILMACNSNSYQTNWKDSTRVNKIRELGTEYYNFMATIGNKKMVSYDMYDKAKTTVECLNNSFGEYLKSNYLDENVEQLYQLKFSTKINDIDFKGMMDLVLVNHDMKVIIPIDLKTTSIPEYDFPKKFIENRYDIQSRLYYAILKEIIAKDDYFKDFSILPFRFIVINKDILNPLIFVDEKCKAIGDITITKKDNRKIILRHPYTIATELKYYLDNNSDIPVGIIKKEANKIYERLELL